MLRWASSSASIRTSSWTTFGARLDHRDRVGGAAHDQVERRLGHVGHRRVDDELVAEPADAHGADRAQEGQRRDDERGRGAVDREDVVRVHAVDRQHGADDLDLVAESLGPERPDRPIDHARVQGRLLGGLALALEEPAGDLARRRTSSLRCRRSAGRSRRLPAPRCGRPRSPAPSSRRIARPRLHRPAWPVDRS